MTDWLEQAVFLKDLDAEARKSLLCCKPQLVPKRTVIFRPGEEAAGFLIILSGSAGVYLTGKSGRELLLYTVSPGQTCVLTTLSMLGGEPYAGEGVAESDLVAVTVPPHVFEKLMALSPTFRKFVFKAFAGQISDVMFLLEQVAFVRVEARLAKVLHERMNAERIVSVTHGELAVAIGSAREVVTRRLEALSSKGIVTLERGHILVDDPAALARAAMEN